VKQCYANGDCVGSIQIVFKNGLLVKIAPGSNICIILPHALRLKYISSSFYHSYAGLLLLSLAPQPSLGLGLLLKIRLNFLEASQQFSFLQGMVVISTPNPHPGGPGLCIYIPRWLTTGMLINSAFAHKVLPRDIF
jgi:hypothetical protein